MAAARLFYVLAAGLTVWTGTCAAVLAMVVATLVFIIAPRQLQWMSRIVWALVLTTINGAAVYAFLMGDIAFWLLASEKLVSAEGLTARRSAL